MLEDGSYSTIKELAATGKINASYLCRVLRLTLLAPDLVEEILDGRRPEELTLPRLMEAGGVGVGVPAAIAPFLTRRSHPGCSHHAPLRPPIA